MPDYIFLLESRLSPEQRAVLERVQELARALELNIYLTGGAVRDLISGQPIRDMDFTVEGNPVKMVRELEKGGARVALENEKMRHYEIVFAGDVDGSLSAARDDVYERPGTKPDYRFAGIMEDLRRRDFSINAIAVSLNVQSRGLLLDPTNGLADLERQEVRALSNHAFTNQPIRLMRILRYAARMGFRLEPRTKEWFDLAVERGLNKNLQSAEIGEEFRALSREENPVATLKSWEAHDLLEAIHPQLQKRKPDYDSLNKLGKARINLNSAGIRTRLARPVLYYTLGRLKPREATGVLKEMGFKSAEIENYEALVPDAQKIVQMLKNKKLNAPRDAYAYVSSVSGEMLSFLEVEFPNPAVLGKLRNYMQKWRPMHMALPANELDALGVPRGPKFDKIMEQLFDMQLRGKGKLPEERVKIFRQLAGIKDEPKKKPEKEKKKRGDTPGAPIAAAGQAAPHAATGSFNKGQKPGATPAVAAPAAAAKTTAKQPEVAAAKQKPAAGKASKPPAGKKASGR
jgi:tRNA nucleotidyltransferase (CCA-adding enzyme)